MGGVEGERTKLDSAWSPVAAGSFEHRIILKANRVVISFSEGSRSIAFSFHNLYCYRRQQMDGQQLYCQTHVPSQPDDPDTGQHKEKLKVLLTISFIQ